MRQTLFYIPHEVLGVPVFGLGWALGLWLAFSVILLIVLSRQRGWTAEIAGNLPLLAIFGIALYAILPMLEVRPPGLEPLGLPIRGYGMFVLAGIVAGMSLSIYRATQMGIDPELIYSLAFWMFAIAIAGARLFYVIQKWSEFKRETLVETVGAIMKFTEGGLVVYGSVIGGILALYLFSRRRQISMFELGDVIAPGMAIGLAFGRIGCLMNGCCYGGVCDGWPLAITFPKYSSDQLEQLSPPYAHQYSLGLVSGELYGFQLGVDSHGKPTVNTVTRGSAAEQAGLRAGVTIAMINGTIVSTLSDARQMLLRGRPQIQIVTTDDDSISWHVDTIPTHSQPVHPTQIYSSINAALLCLVVWFAYPFRRRHGDILLLLFGLYSITRFLLEAIRTDEGGQLGTSFTISQLVSLGVLALCVGLWLVLLRQPRIDTPSSVAAAA
ncbi:MAG: prolipoprotein diacylglyceryl transferase [Planctomycetota bacterium]|nr:prolipoprotein diacylglyceryl transferase [Planctomycetota bacterium]